jgi:uncharacterized protein with von Willebrand factor type A (vWA) domain
MTLIIKELTIRGEVIGDEASSNKGKFSDAELLILIEAMKKEIKEECIEKFHELMDKHLIR